MDTEQFQAHFEAESQHWWFAGRRRILKEVGGVLVPPDPRSLVVDIGCGTGGNVRAFQRDYPIIGVDASEFAIDTGRNLDPAGDYRVGSGPQAIGSRIDHARLFLCTDVLEHIEQEKQFLKEWVEAAPVGAYFLITVPADPKLWSAHDVSHGHYRRYTKETWLRVLDGLPVEHRFTSYFNSYLYPVVRLVRWIGSRRKKSWGAAGTDLSLPPYLFNKALTALFASERHRLVHQVNNPAVQGFPFGVSLMSVFRKVD